MQKRKLQGGEISAPQHPTVKSIKESWRHKVESGHVSLGVPCSPFTLIHHTVNNGELEKHTKIITGRKFPLKYIRQKLLSSQEKYMRLSTDDDIQNMSMEELRIKMSTLNEVCTPSNTVDELQQRYKRLERTRTLAVWHDHATLLGLGTVMIMVHVVYDAAVFYTQTEFESTSKEPTNIQSTIQRPVIHMIAAGSSLQDRLDCLLTLSEDNGVRPVRASGSRWISHKLNATKRVVAKYGAYTAHVSTLSCDSSVKPSDRAKLTGYLRKWVDAKYLLGCAFFVELFRLALEKHAE